MSNKTYDILKNISMIVIPALVVLLNTVGEIWKIPYTTEITATISAIGVFLGAMLKISSNKYFDKIYDQEEENAKEIETAEVEEYEL